MDGGWHIGHARRGQREYIQGGEIAPLEPFGWKGGALVAQLVEFPLDDGGVLLVQAAGPDTAGDGLGLASSQEDRLKKASESLESALNAITPGLKTVAGKLRELSPDEVTVEFGLTATAEAGVVLAKGTTEVHFTVRLKWADPNSPGPGTDGDDT